jgi:tetratricopeptide (TPR) repeat protein
MLAAAFGLEYQSSGDLKDFEGALQYYQAAVNLTPGGPERFQILEGLATSFAARYKRLGDAKDLEAALRSYQAAVKIVPDDSHRARCLAKFAISLTDQYQNREMSRILKPQFRTIRQQWNLPQEVTLRGHGTFIVLQWAWESGIIGLDTCIKKQWI